MKADYQKSNEFKDQRREPGSQQIEELDRHSQVVETRSNRSSGYSEPSSARRGLYLKVKARKEQQELQARLENLKREVIQREITDLQDSGCME